MSLDPMILRPVAPTVPIPAVRRPHRYRPQTRTQRVRTLVRGAFRRARHSAPSARQVGWGVLAAIVGVLIAVLTVAVMALLVVLT